MKAVSKYVSDVKIIPHNIEVIFHYLSDFENFSKYVNEEILQAISEKVQQIKISNFESDRDSCRFDIAGLGKSEIRITERTPFTTIKIEGQGDMPVEIKFWIQLLSLEAYKTKMRLTLHAEMGMMLKLLAGNKLEKGIDQLAEAMTHLPFH